MSALDYRDAAGELFKADARATRTGDVEIGAWACGDDPEPKQCRWLSVRLTPGNASWAFVKQGNPQWVIAGREFFGSFFQ